MNIPNLITVIRIIFIPATLMFLINDLYLLGLICFLISALLDLLDGFLARVLNQATRIGSFLDPLADKLLIISTLVFLVVVHKIPLWFLILVGSRDIFLLSGFSLTYILLKRIYIVPSVLGKITTFLQIFTIINQLLSLAHCVPLEKYSSVMITIAALFTIISGLDYISRGVIHLSRNSSIGDYGEKMKVKKRN